MGPHDELMSKLIVIQRYLESYVDEFEPVFGARCLEHMGRVMLIAHSFPEDEAPDTHAPTEGVKK